MNKKEAIKVLAQVCAIYKGTLEEHKVLQQALEVISKEEKEVAVKND